MKDSPNCTYVTDPGIEITERLDYDHRLQVIGRLGVSHTTNDIVGAIAKALGEFQAKGVVVDYTGLPPDDRRILVPAVLKVMKPVKSPIRYVGTEAGDIDGHPDLVELLESNTAVSIDTAVESLHAQLNPTE